MKLLFFASFIIFGCWLTYELHKTRKIDANAELKFWEKESQANSVRKQSLADLDYVNFPFDQLPTADSFAGQEIPESLIVLEGLKDQKMINLNGISNTDLKLKYGAPNLTILSEYDSNYATFARNIYLLSEYLYELKRVPEALILLEQALETGTDSSQHYKLLAKIYYEQGEKDKLAHLRESAQKLDHSIMKNAILNAISEYESKD